jgi:hypothetical protein
MDPDEGPLGWTWRPSTFPGDGESGGAGQAAAMLAACVAVALVGGRRAGGPESCDVLAGECLDVVAVLSIARHATVALPASRILDRRVYLAGLRAVVGLLHAQHRVVWLCCCRRSATVAAAVLKHQAGSCISTVECSVAFGNGTCRGRWCAKRNLSSGSPQRGTPVPTGRLRYHRRHPPRG